MLWLALPGGTFLEQARHTAAVNSKFTGFAQRIGGPVFSAAR
jgi:hypothetical protein